MQVPKSLLLDEVVEDMAAFAGRKRKLPSHFVLHNYQFGGPRPSYFLDRRHVENIYSISKANIPTTFCFSETIISRWKMMNSLLVQRHVANGSLGPDVDVNAGSMLATLIGFPLLEQVAQLWTGAWDDDGRLRVDIDESVGLVDQSGKPRTSKTGRRLAMFGDRMLVLRSRLSADFRAGLDMFDKALASPEFPGATENRPLFQRMSSRRNAWMHGGAFEEGESYLPSLLMSFFYVASVNHSEA